MVAEIGPAKGGNAQRAERYEDDRKMAAVKAEKNITLVLNCRLVGVVPCGGGATGKRIASVIGRDVVTGVRTRFVAPLFVDCTGDGGVGALAGADWRLGRESKAETGEKDAIDVADKQILGASCQWYAAKVKSEPARRAEFPNEPWMIRFNEETVALGTTRVMRTHGMMGEVVGMAASICKKHGCDPRGVYTDHLDELEALMTKGIGLGKPQPPQKYNQGGCKFR